MTQMIKTMGIVLKSSKHTAEAARLLDIFTPEGRISAVIRGVEKPKAKLAVASQPFCFGEYMLAEKNGYYTVTDCAVTDSFFSIAYNLDAYVLGSGILESLTKVIQAGEKNVYLFTLTIKALGAMAYEKAEPTCVFIKFLIEVLKSSGFGFELDKCAVCGKDLDGENGVGLVYSGSGAICKKDKAKKDHVSLSNEEWQILNLLNRTQMEDIARIEGLDRQALNGCLSATLKQFYYRTGEKINCLTKYI